MLTQDIEETVTIPSKTKSEKKNEKKEVKPESKKKEVMKPVNLKKIEAEKAEENRKLEKVKEEKARREAEEAASRRVSGAFGKGAKMINQGTSKGNSVSENTTGNVLSGRDSGFGESISCDLGGRSWGEGGLPRPVYNVQDEGRVVVDITVNPAGFVIATAINRHTNTVNPALRKAAEDAAKKARFNAVSGLNNQQGTITYDFKLK
ncbi:protein containing TonB [gut metagenome]|uniref:Protein containing TonB n=1 Tax=gut metagenome TaxID=749906 RepID=J9D4R0_9ZZZZ